MDQRPSQNLVRLIQTAMGFCHSQVLFTLHRIGVFTFLVSSDRTAAEVAAHCRTSPRHTANLLNAAVALGLLEKTADGRFTNTALTSSFLVEGAPQYMGHWLNLWATWYHRWGHLEETVRTGEPSEDPVGMLGANPEYTRNFILAMHEYARGPGKELINQVDLSQKSRLVDVGGGPGTYAVLLAQANPQLHAVVFDLPGVVDIAREVIDSYDLGARVSTVAGDYMTDSFGHQDYDVALLSNMLHQEDPESCRAILRKAYDALQPGGQLIVQAMFLNATKDGPVWPALQSVHLSVLYHGGTAYSIDETLEMVAAAGFLEARPKRMSLLNAESLVLARRP